MKKLIGMKYYIKDIKKHTVLQKIEGNALLEMILKIVT